MEKLKISKKAVLKVKNPIEPPIDCSICCDFETGENNKNCIELINNKEIYGKSYGSWPYAYRCTICHSYVGLHPFTDIPLGTLADASLRKARKENKEPFEMLHRKGLLSRNEAYKKLSEKLNIPLEECHFGWFDEKRCRDAGKAAREIFLSIINN